MVENFTAKGGDGIIESGSKAPHHTLPLQSALTLIGALFQAVVIYSSICFQKTVALVLL